MSDNMLMDVEMSSRRTFWLSPERFIAWCRWVSLPVLVLTTLLITRYHLATGAQFFQAPAIGVTTPRDIPADFAQFYMGGVIARYGIWADMYPTPRPGSLNNPGEPLDSESRPVYRELADKTGVNEGFRYILTPPATLLLYPLSLLSLRNASWVWLGLSLGCAWGVACLSSIFYRRLVGKRTYVEGLLVLLVALAPDTRRSTNPGNLSPLIALLIGLCVWNLLQKETRRTGVWIVVGAVLKYVTAVFIPLLIAMRRWRSLGWTIGIGLFSLLISISIMGTEPFVAYINLFPVLNRPFIGPSRFNQTFYGLAWEFCKVQPLPAGIVTCIHLAQLVTLILVLTLIFRRKRTDWEDPAIVIGAAASLLLWMLLFSPVVWVHYVLYVSVFFGWVTWEATRPTSGWAVRSAALLTALFLWMPYSGGEGRWSLYQQPMSFHVFYAQAAMFGIALRRMTLAASAVTSKSGYSGSNADSAPSPLFAGRQSAVA